MGRRQTQLLPHFYIDPPHAPTTRTANFTSYTSLRFGRDDQAGLRALRVPARRAINSNAARRGTVFEYLITNVGHAGALRSKRLN